LTFIASVVSINVTFIETAVFNKLSELTEVYFWRERNKEVDFILSFPEGLLPVEVKFQEKVAASEISSLLKFCARRKVKQAVIITKNEMGKEKIEEVEIYKIPSLAI
jgi:predicted AAA+ superfamily ATPase